MIVKDIIINDILPEIWPMLVIICVILVTLRLAYIFKGRKRVVLHTELLTLVFIIYILCLFHIVTFQDINYGTNNYIPFKEIFRYDINSTKFIKNIVGNIMMFKPYGFFASYYLKNRKFSTIFILSLVVSLTIEIVQLNIGRVFDIDDIMLNLLGGYLGFLAYYLLCKLWEKIPEVLKSELVLNIVSIIILMCVIVLL